MFCQDILDFPLLSRPNKGSFKLNHIERLICSWTLIKNVFLRNLAIASQWKRAYTILGKLSSYTGGTCISHLLPGYPFTLELWPRSLSPCFFHSLICWKHVLEISYMLSIGLSYMDPTVFWMNPFLTIQWIGVNTGVLRQLWKEPENICARQRKLTQKTWKCVRPWSFQFAVYMHCLWSTKRNRARCVGGA
jgi:hypothetical protein